MKTATPEEIYALTEDFQSGSLSEAAQEEFVTQLETESGFEQEVTHLLNAQETAFQLGKRELLHQTEQAYTVFLKRQKSRRIVLLTLPIAAGILLFLIFRFDLLGLKQAPLSGPEIFAQHFTRPANPQRGGIEPTKVKARELYSDKEYQLAIDDYSQHLKQPNFQFVNEARYYIGHAYLNLEDDDQALNWLEQVAPTSGYSDDAIWYRALLLVKTERFPEAILLLDQLIADPGSNHHAQAEDILNSID